MAINSVLPLIFFCLALLTTTTTTATAAASYFLDPQEIPVTTTTTTVPPLPLNITSIIFAIISAGNFQNWATLLSENPSLLPRNFTLFLPSYNHKNYSSSFTKTTQEAQQLRSYFVLLYHIVPIRLSFSDLCRFSSRTRLPTLLPDYNLFITKNNNYSVSCSICINGSCITRPDIYQDEFSIVHGVGSAFDYTNYSEDITVFLSVLGAYWIIFFNPFQPFPVIIDDDNNLDNEDVIIEDDNEIDYEAVIELERIEELRMEEEERQQKAIEDAEDERRRQEEELWRKIDEEVERERQIRRERDESERTEDEEHDEELRRQYEIDEVRYFQELDD